MCKPNYRSSTTKKFRNNVRPSERIVGLYVSKGGVLRRDTGFRQCWKDGKLITDHAADLQLVE